MDDSFSLLAKSIRQQKINKDELLNNLKQISEAQNKKDKYIKNILKIQKIFRGHLFRKKYSLTLDEINTKTIIDYLYEKKKKRIYNHSKEIISFFITKYIVKVRKNKKKEMLLEQYKIHCSNLIKARFKGILVRKHVKEKIYLIKKAKLKIFKHILSYRTILILKSNTMQNLLINIAKIKKQIKNLNKEKDNIKIKDLKNKLSKNINLFHDTYYYTKENCNWIIEKKTSDKWDKKYFDIIYQKTENEKNKNKDKKEIKSGNNGYSNYLLEYYNDSDENANEDINQNYLTSNRKLNYSSTVNSTQKKNKYENRKYPTSKNISEFNIDELKKENKDLNEYNKKNQSKIEENLNRNDTNNTNNNYTEREKRKYISDKNLNKFSNFKDENKKLRKEINNIDLNNINNNFKYKNKNIKKEKEEFFKQQITNKNIYQQREERPIKPLKINNILNCENPFGLRDNNFKKSNTLLQDKYIRNSLPNNNNQNILYQKRTILNSKILNKANKSNEEKEEYEYNRKNSEKLNNNGNYNFINRDEKPIGIGKKIDYEALFGEDGEIIFDGDPFGGVKQFETNKNKIHCKSNSTGIRKKPVYDARKAIEEAKLKEAKEGKKEKHTEFREFLKEMKKISHEEKIKNNNNNKNNGNINNNELDMKKSQSESLNKNGNEIFNGNNIYKNNNYIEDTNKNIEINKKKESNNNNTNKREKSSNKSSSNKMLRKKLHDLEKAPAPVLKIKEAKSKVECWYDNHTNNIGNKYMEFSSQPNGQNKVKKFISKDYEEINNFIINKKIENRIENYVDKKLAQLNLQIDKINDIFSIDSYFEQKEIKMKKYINIPYINENNNYVTNYSNKIYNDLIGDIYKEYKNLK